MKLLVQIARVLTGLLFIFSGVIKLNDPSGFSIKLNEYFDVFAQDVASKQDSLKLSLFEGSNELGSKTFVLYSFDKSREIDLQSLCIPRKDTAGKILGFEANVELSLGAETVADYDFPLPDSLSTKLFSVKSEIAGKSVLAKSYKASVINEIDETFSIDVKDYVKKEGFLFGFFKAMKNQTLWLSIFICAIEVILGFALIVGWKNRLTAWLLLLMIVFFTFLTFYAAYYNKVTDCGCFGDFIKLKPWQSFYKDLILLGLILIILIGAKYIKPWFSKKFGWKFMTVISMLALGFGIFCYMYLPVWDFLPFKKGNDLLKLMTEVPKGERAQDSIHIYYVMHKGNDSVEVPFIRSPYKEYTDKIKAGWKAGRRTEKLIVKGYNWPIHDFSITDPQTGADKKDSLLSYEGYQLVWIVVYTDKAYNGGNKELKEIYNWSVDKGLSFLALTASSPEPAAQYASAQKLEFKFFSSDQKMLMTMARYSPTLYLLNGPVVIEKWSARNLPSTKKLQKLISR